MHRERRIHFNYGINLSDDGNISIDYNYKDGADHSSGVLNSNFGIWVSNILFIILEKNLKK